MALKFFYNSKNSKYVTKFQFFYELKEISIEELSMINQNYNLKNLKNDISQVNSVIVEERVKGF